MVSRSTSSSRTRARLKAVEPILLLGKERFALVDIRIRVKGGGHVSQMYAVRQAVARAASAYTKSMSPRSFQGGVKDLLLAPTEPCSSRTRVAWSRRRRAVVGARARFPRLTVKFLILLWKFIGEELEMGGRRVTW